MMPILRRILALISASGLAASLAIYVASYTVSTMDGLFRWAIILHVGVFFLLLSIYLPNYSALRRASLFWKEFGRGMPKWVVPTIKSLGAFFVIHFVIFLLQSHAAAPEFKDGEYVLNDHGHIVKVLTHSEYLRLKGGELRLFATGWIFFYFVPTVYWWFRRPNNKAS
jgi:hypothetical protein